MPHNKLNRFDSTVSAELTEPALESAQGSLAGMHRKHATRPRWSTSSFGRAADTSPMELAALSRHMNRCTVPSGAFSALRRVGEAIDDFAAPRLITTLRLVALLAVCASLLS